jgi:hypothetical protein
MAVQEVNSPKVKKRTFFLPSSPPLPYAAIIDDRCLNCITSKQGSELKQVNKAFCQYLHLYCPYSREVHYAKTLRSKCERDGEINSE